MSLKLTSWNVNGIRAVSKKDGFKEWFSNNDADIINLQETRAHKEQFPKNLVDVDGFHSYFTAAEKKGYSSVATYSKIEPTEVYHGLGYPEIDSEGRIVRLDFEEFSLFNIYFPNSGSKAKRLDFKIEFCNNLLNNLIELKDEGRNIVVTGDFNIAHKEIDLARPDANHESAGFLPEERQWFSELLDAGFVDTFRIFNQDGENYTWWSYRTRARERNVGWRLDYFVVNKEFEKKVISAGIESDVMGSDHCPVTLELDL